MTTRKSVITPKKSLFDINLKELYNFRDLLFLFVKRDFISVYKQTVLGPLWFFIQPLITTLIFSVVFGQVAQLAPKDTPTILFYLAGLTCWNYFSDSLTKTSNTFVDNQGIFGKVYFPRLITPISIVISALIKFSIQFLLFVGFLLFYLYNDTPGVNPNMHLLLFPILLLLMGLLGLGIGLIISSLTTKYRDFRFLIQFGIQLWMYATPIIYPLNSLNGNIRTVALLNPMTGIIETFKYGFIGIGTLNLNYLLYTTACTVVTLIAGILIFNRTEQNFMDTI